jgi:pilus assembly protein Flp/PilA
MPMLKAEPESTQKSHAETLSRRAAGDEQGGTAIEYALIAAGIGAAVAATVYSLGTSTAGLYQTIANLL